MPEAPIRASWRSKKPNHPLKNHSNRLNGLGSVGCFHQGETNPRLDGKDARQMAVSALAGDQVERDQRGQ